MRAHRLSGGVVVIGAGGFGRQVPWILSDMCAANHADLWLRGFADDSGGLETPEGYTILGTIDEVLAREDGLTVVCAVGDPRVRSRLIDRCVNRGARFVTLVHPSVLRPDRVVFGEACVVCAGTIFSTNVTVGRGVVVNFGCRIGHDVRVEDLASIMPNVSIGGETVIGEGAFLGIGATIVNRVKVGAWSVIGAGSVVIDDVPSNTVVAGVPSRVIRTVAPDAMRTPI